MPNKILTCKIMLCNKLHRLFCYWWHWAGGSMNGNGRLFPFMTTQRTLHKMLNVNGSSYNPHAIYGQVSIISDLASWKVFVRFCRPNDNEQRKPNITHCCLIDSNVKIKGGVINSPYACWVKVCLGFGIKIVQFPVYMSRFSSSSRVFQLYFHNVTLMGYMP